VKDSIPKGEWELKQKLIIVSNFEGKGDPGRIKYKSVPFCVLITYYLNLAHLILALFKNNSIN